MASLLREVRGCEIDGDPLGGQGEPRCDQGRAHPFPGLGHGLVGQADDHERDGTGRDLNLHVDGTRFDALEGDGCYASHHPSQSPIRIQA
jgi:hypothetical protein